MIEFPVGSQRRQQRPESVCLSQSSGLLWGNRSGFLTYANALNSCDCRFMSIWIHQINIIQIVSTPYGSELHCHNHQTLMVVFYLAILSVGVCFAGDGGTWISILTAHHSFRSEEGTVFPWRNDGDYGVCPNRRNASSWAEPSDGGGASVDHPWRFHRPQNGGWEHGEQHPGFRQRTGSIFRSKGPICYLAIPA